MNSLEELKIQIKQWNPAAVKFVKRRILKFFARDRCKNLLMVLREFESFI